MTIRAYAIFEGGGAKGIGHVGAVKALEDLDIQLLGVGGASAGSIVAALVAAGYTADEIVGERSNLFTALGTDPVQTVGRFDWLLLRLALWSSPMKAFVFSLASLVPFFLAWHLFASPLPAPAPALLWALTVPLIVTALLLLSSTLVWAPFRLVHHPAAGASPGLWRLLSRLGWFDGTAAVHLLDRAFRAKIGGAALVRMRDLVAANRLPLKLVATDIDRGRLLLVDAGEPGAVVADAVVASMGIPFLFPPARIRGLSALHAGARFVDGGLLGNLPTFAFLADRRNVSRTEGQSERIPILAFTLDAQAGDAVGQPLGFGGFLSRVLRTGIFGSQAQNAALVPGVIEIRLETGLDLLDFDISQERAFAVRERCRARAEAQLRSRLLDDPKERQADLEAIETMVAHRLDALGATPADARLRLALLAPAGPLELETLDSRGREDDPDQFLRYAIGSPAAPAAFRMKAPHHFAFAGQTAADLHTTPEEFVRQPHLVSLIAIPIFRKIEDWAANPRPDPTGLLVLDGDFDLKPLYDDHDFIQELGFVAVELAHWLKSNEEPHR